MPPTPEDTPWDFSHVLNLINSLSPKPQASALRSVPPEPPQDDELKQMTADESSGGLGDFNKVWEFLGVPHDAPPPLLPLLTPPPSEPSADKEKEAYASDGAACYQSVGKGHKWLGSDEDGPDTLANGVDDVFGTAAADVSDAPAKDAAGLTKTQRKRENRKARRAAEAEKRAAKAKTVSDVESGDDARLYTPARKASVHIVEPPPIPDVRYNLRSRAVPSTPQVSKTKDVPTPQAVPFTEPKKAVSKPGAHVFSSTSKPIDIPRNSKKLEDSAIPLKLSGSDKDGAAKNHSGSPVRKRDALKSRSPPKQHESFSSPAPAGMNSGYLDAIMNQKPLYFQGPGTSPSQQQPRPLTIRDKDDRNLHFLLTLIRNFGEDKHWLAKPAQLVNHTQAPDGIHVFIDFSNIHIGFQNCVKTMRGLPVQARIRREDIDFEALVLLMERRRPVAKRILVGSLPAIPAFERAKSLGYETNILDKVFKARELTDRQKYFRQRENRASSGGEGSGSGSETNTAAPMKAKEAWVEQGVDEILHLKMLESVVDVDKPSTIVLATGDAATAEYSQGFMRMVERALKKGWRVELVSWQAGISNAYKKRDFRQKWGDAFRIISLDDYVEDLLDT
ncbi:hypothetical protein BFW01_g5462 [Lasiodiplodia theobromae]|uniref:Uncharacterized protein n=1 Tax=Lasiodiplodia theobromae TaxID=45133 RepID=A0A5N5DQ09_9PEZI|nr:uncharacterized protein LTHEOB_889 [Lasiodiplodia theobromae]KAB2580019.1 hypothetical protein DBV05_g1503 [Lasiodiplodia theobromae]KAF4540947.1 hypothetical protein LTHEOB_889 [Lasiodiplodia theobromae]KAF9634567.1 hypothetical protein BFW01_g5462 [Lasiodiplodia theobromae]